MDPTLIGLTSYQGEQIRNKQRVTSEYTKGYGGEVKSLVRAY